MSRVRVNGRYKGESFILLHAEGERAGRAYKVIRPGEVITYPRPENDPAGDTGPDAEDQTAQDAQRRRKSRKHSRKMTNADSWYACGLRVNGEFRIKLVALPDGWQGWDRVELQKYAELRRNGLFLQPVRGLWATSLRSAQRGVFHLYRTPQNRIERALDQHSYGKQQVERVPRIHGEVGRHNGSTPANPVPGGHGYTCVSDGELLHQTTATRTYGNATVLIQWTLWPSETPSGWKARPTRILLTPEASERLVVALIHAGPHATFDQVAMDLADAIS